MLSKNKIKLIKSLEKKKFRIENGLFVAEGPKLVEELLAVWSPIYVCAVDTWMQQNKKHLSGIETDIITNEELERVSLLRTPQQVLALFRLPDNAYAKTLNVDPTSSIAYEKRGNLEVTLATIAERELCLMLDGVQDPGNIGTIVRLADWFGIEHIFCSLETADIYAPKAIQATMGAIARVKVHYLPLVEALKDCKAPIFGTHLDGENIYEKTLSNHGVIVMGNEGNGVSTEVSNLVTSRLYIPPYPTDRDKVESLNVAIATAVVCAEFRRRV